MPQKTPFEEAPIETQLVMFQLVEQFLNVHVAINQMGSEFKFAEDLYINTVGILSVQEVFKVTQAGWKTELTHLGKVQYGIKTLETQMKEQKEMNDLLKECDSLSETAKQVSEDPSSGVQSLQSKRRRRMEDCDKLEEHALKVLRACKRLKGIED